MKKYFYVFFIILSSCSVNIENNFGTFTGTQIIKILDTLSIQDREKKIFELIENKNYPHFLENFVKITVKEELNGVNYLLEYFVTPDYFSLGVNNDYFLIPMSPLLAQKVADYFDCMLPTKKIVDQIYSSSKIKFYPQPIKPSPEMITIKVFAKHNDSIKIQREKYFSSFSISELCSGHKKDVIISNLIYNNLKPKVPKPVVIYGWHKLDGNPIQPPYNGHDENYADYSHGIRLVKKYALLNGQKVFLPDILKDSTLSKLISDEGIISKPYYISD